MLVKYFRNKLVSPQTGLRLKTLRRVNHILWRITELRGCCQPNCFSARSISKPAHLQFHSKKIYSIYLSVYVSIQSPYKHGAKPTSTWDFLRLTTTTPESAHMLVHSRQVQRPVAYADLPSIYGINHFKACDSHVQSPCVCFVEMLKQSISSTKAEEEWKTVDQAMGLTCY